MTSGQTFDQGKRAPSVFDIDFSEYDFLDFGAGTGESLVRTTELLGGEGLGIEFDPTKVEEARRLGRNVVLGNVLELPRSSVNWVVMDNLLEHLPSLDAVARVLAAATRSARYGVYIRHPSFEGEGYLRGLGLKQYWHDWSGHPTHVLLSDMLLMLRELGLGLCEIRPVHKVLDSSHPTVIPLAAPIDQHSYDPLLHGPKALMSFSQPVYCDLDILVPTAGNAITLEYTGDPDIEGSRPRLSQESRWLRRSIEAEELRQSVSRLRSRRSVRLADALGRALRLNR